MERTIDTEMVRTKNPDKSPYPNVYQPWGGHMPLPPRECKNRERSFVDQSSGIRWLLTYWCSKEKCPSGPCDRRKEYTAKGYAEYWKEMRRLTNNHRDLDGLPPLSLDAWDGKGV